MMRLVYILIIGLLFPATAFAAPNPNAQLVNRCVAGTIQKDTFFSKASIKEWMPRQVTSRASTCNDELVYIDVGLGAGVTICSIRKCTSGDQKYGCKQGQTQPFVLFATSDGKPPAKISKCHGAQAIANALAQTVETESPDALVALTTPPNLSTTPPTQSPPVVPAPPAQSVATKQLIDVFDGRVPDKGQAAQVLVDAGVPAPVAQQAAQMIASGDKAGADALLTSVGLNPDVVKNQTGLAPDNRGVVAIGAPDPSTLVRQNTGFVSPDWSRPTQSSASNPFEGILKQLLSLFGLGGSSASSPSPAPSGSPVPSAAQQEVSSLAQRVLEKIQGGTVSQDLNPILRPVATLFTQPAVVTRGSPIVVSWSSVGMKSDAPCVLNSGNAVLAQKNEGTQIVPTVSMPRGEVTFTLSCTARSGESIERMTTVTVN